MRFGERRNGIGINLGDITQDSVDAFRGPDHAGIQCSETGEAGPLKPTERPSTSRSEEVNGDAHGATTSRDGKSGRPEKPNENDVPNRSQGSAVHPQGVVVDKPGDSFFCP